ncbi:hypothetical protein B0H10DRAFT_2014061 [Mycena sp. CBHHK59/15]|nr:hypothetical protein B0H10DRAFT_2014061 [Mycena sp. CBHHK59/15]
MEKIPVDLSAPTRSTPRYAVHSSSRPTRTAIARNQNDARGSTHLPTSPTNSSCLRSLAVDGSSCRS